MTASRLGFTYLGHDDKLLARKLELPDGVTQDDLGETVRVYLWSRQ